MFRQSVDRLLEALLIKDMLQDSHANNELKLTVDIQLGKILGDEAAPIG
jgi:hypothetical protein